MLFKKLPESACAWTFQQNRMMVFRSACCSAWMQGVSIQNGWSSSFRLDLAASVEAGRKTMSRISVGLEKFCVSTYMFQPSFSIIGAQVSASLSFIWHRGVWKPKRQWEGMGLLGENMSMFEAGIQLWWFTTSLTTCPVGGVLHSFSSLMELKSHHGCMGLSWYLGAGSALITALVRLWSVQDGGWVVISLILTSNSKNRT